MKLNEADQEIFDELIKHFVEKYGNELSHQIIRDIYKLHRNLSNKLGINNLPIAFIYRGFAKKRLQTPIENGGYEGMPLKEIAEKENISLGFVYKLFHEVYSKNNIRK